MKKIKTLKELENFHLSKGGSLALVPTMGALHDGHISLVEEGLKHADICMPYIYVNPTQFAEGEDLDIYPRTLNSDLEKFEKAGAQAVWLPSTQEIYPNGVKAIIKAGDLSKSLEGEFRPHFFDGVVSVLHRMFILSKPDYVMMGEKDFQQLQVTQKMVDELNMNVEIIGVPTVRDKNGLALSSRNAYLNDEEYKVAIHLNKILKNMAHGNLNEKQACQKLLEAGFDKIDYCTIRNSKIFGTENPNRALAAVWVGKTRLIDNMAIE